MVRLCGKHSKAGRRGRRPRSRGIALLPVTGNVPWLTPGVITPSVQGRGFRVPGPRAHFSRNSRRISFCVLNSPKSTRRTGLRLPYIPENSENAFKRVLGAKKRKSPKKARRPTPGAMTRCEPHGWRMGRQPAFCRRWLAYPEAAWRGRLPPVLAAPQYLNWSQPIYCSDRKCNVTRIAAETVRRDGKRL